MSSSPMTAAKLHDNLVLLADGKRWPVPGASMVTVTLSANTDSQDLPADGKAVTQLNEAAGEVSVKVTMWKAEQWDAYQSLLAHLRRGTKDGPAVFTSTHPEIRGRRIKRLYFVSEEGGGYSPKGGYSATLKFSEKLKEKDKAAAVGDTGTLNVPGAPGGAGSGGNGGSPTEAESKVLKAAVANLSNQPRPSRDGRSNSATPGNCSVWARWTGADAGVPDKLFGASAMATQALFRGAGMWGPWDLNSQKNLRAGQFVFFPEPVGLGHIGVVMGFDKDGMPLVAGNSYATAKFGSGKDARGIVRMNQLGVPTGVGYPGGAPSGPKIFGPTAPLPQNMPSSNVQPPTR